MMKKMIVLIAFIYIASMLFCGDGVGKKLVEEKFPHLTYSDKECDDSKKKELRIVEDEDTAGGILSYEELAAMENENASVTTKSGFTSLTTPFIISRHSMPV